MKRLGKKFKALAARFRQTLFHRGRAPLTEAEMADLRAEFRSRYKDFIKLLSANRRSLETMSEMESALESGRVFGMVFIRSRMTALADNVRLMIEKLDALGPGRHGDLFERFDAIQEEIGRTVMRGPAPVMSDLVVHLDDVGRESSDTVGAKMANLGEVRNALGLATPPGFVITAAAYRAFFEHNGLQEEIDRRYFVTMPHTTDQLFEMSSSLRRLVMGAEVPHDLREAILGAYRKLESETASGVRVSLRSSGIGEDTAQASFAGQYLSRLNVPPDEIVDAYKEVVASKYSPQAMHYRFQRGLRDADLAMCVGCLAMVDCAGGGVAYTANPLDPSDIDVQITAALGLPKGVVEGDVPADLYVVAREEPPRVRERKVEPKHVSHVNSPQGGVERLATDKERAERPVLTDGQSVELAVIALRLEEHYGSPRDVEWALDRDGRILILQCRPLNRLDSVRSGVPARKHDGRALVRGGSAASPGVASGIVRWVRNDSDAKEFPRGCVLALSRPDPERAALLGKAVAVLAREGTLEGHLATVSREYGIPALFHLGDAVDAIEDGMEVTVDADGLSVYRGRDEAAMARSRPRSNLMEGSRIYKTLQGVLNHVAPLTLINPESPDFQASGCRSMHDIIRYCHEMSVKEMFEFGKRHRFPERAAKQLFTDVPMHYWVIDLDDGFRHEVKGRYVKMKDIACRPMRALTAGFTAVPWEGPPAISGRGFASILFEATANPELGVHLKSPAKDKTYFMISRHYVNVQSRMGFHFTTVDAFVGEDAAENYASFSFSGGAADLDRRVTRTRFIGDILEERGYRIRVNMDSLRARVEGLEEEAMLRELRVLGYMVMHTRQLDMIMDQPKRVARYGEKIRKDLADI
ncbi:MAG: pyruvate, water dikinase [Deltaproteobacteria bacterium]|nr:pyruvate, water dikinase [Deltaproteobacteria bacterium]